MSVTVLVRYLADLERWEIGIDWALSRTDLVMLDDEVSEGRLPTGGVAEIVIDAGVPRRSRYAASPPPSAPRWPTSSDRRVAATSNAP